MATATALESGRRLRMLGDELEFGRDLIELEEAPWRGVDAGSLRRLFDQRGYLLLRGLHARDEVMAARAEILAALARRGLLDAQAPADEGRVGAARQPHFFAQEEIDALPAYGALVTAPRLLDLLAGLLRAPVRAFPHRWLRCLPQGASCGIHYDIVYMNRGTDRVLTCWMPVDDLPLERGPLALCLGSREFDELRASYGRLDADSSPHPGTLDGGPREVAARFGGRWATAAFEAGDVLIFGMYMLHGALVNSEPVYRLTSDTRYQPAGERMDPRVA